ncbi:PucR family transcriptional regulator [Lentibacillus cibarius]|uniref:PucR family transcriptional regulator n=1 Tax=Lentibacillus cibarius TaxID=2583219 RepID=A0A549YG90_9BACI|nr:PucR family transcriptional regulator [Lentibacillus cibarius]TRM10903.1 PucR family transcriptional regulator [Lentibacillus cibarius]
MYVTIKDILKLDEFEDVEIIAGKSDLNHRVRNVYFMEVPDIYAYIEQNGLLLTTLYPIADNPAQIQTLIPKLAEMNIAGVAIKPGRYVDEIPDIMIKQANEYGIPLMKLPDGANLSTLTHQILTILLDARTSVLEFRDKMHQQLLGLLLEDANLNRFVESVAKLIDAPVLLLNNDLEYVDSSLDKSDNKITIRDQSNEIDVYSADKNNFSVQVNETIYEKNDIYIQFIIAGGDEFGYLVVLLEQGKSLNSNLIVAIEQASFLVAFLFQKEQALLQKERNYLSNFIRDIFNNQYGSQTEITEKAKVFKWNFQFPMAILSIKTNIKDSEKKLAIYNRMLDSGMIERIVSQAVDIPIENCKTLYYNDSLVCFISIVFEKNLKQKLKKAGDSIVHRFRKLSNLGVSISDTVYDMDQIREYYSNSMLVFKIYKEELDKQSFVRFYEDIGLFRLFHYVEEISVLQEFVTEKLGSVIEYDERKGANLLETLSYYIQNNTNLQKTADDMYVHYNTMRYRMSKLKELGINDEDGFELAEISLAYQLHQYLKFKKE